MKYLLPIITVLLLGVAACQPEETNEPIAWLCPNINNEQYVHYEGTDSAKCWLPNVFSANNDGSNDIYKAGTYNVNQLYYTFKSGNNIVFQSDSSFKWWDGAVNGQQAQQGVYNCIVNGTDNWGNSFILNGQVSLINNIDMIGSPTAYINCDTCQYASQWDYVNGNYDATRPTNEFWSNVVCE